MRGKCKFTHGEAEQIRRLIEQRCNSTREEQRIIRGRMRKLSFYISDFDGAYAGFTVDDFDALATQGRIVIESCGHEAELTAVSSYQGIAHSGRGSKGRNDEAYIIDLCDKVVGLTAQRQHKFPFLRGDSGRPLPVDAYYPSLHLVIEYQERQHAEPVALFDRRETVSGVNRAEQRRIYDQRRREVLPHHGITLVVFSYNDFSHDRHKRLHRRESEDLAVIEASLVNWVRLPPVPREGG